jgi:hypothetical protein
MIPIVFESLHEKTPKHGYWDYNLIERIVARKVWLPVNDLLFREYNHIVDVPTDDGLVIVIPIRYHLQDIDEINKQIKRFKWVLIIAMNDEEGLFNSREIIHPNVKVWVMTPRTNHQLPDNVRVIGTGIPPDTSMIGQYKFSAQIRVLDWYFSGQITTTRRIAMVEQLERLDTEDHKFVLNKTDGFTKGFSHEEYYENFANSKVAICPSGAVTPDTFRLYEAMEAGCFPIVDDVSPVYDSAGFFHMLYPDAPFAILKNYDDLPGYIEDALNGWPANANRVFAWWQRKKRELVYNLQDDVKELSGIKFDDVARGISESDKRTRDAITVVIPVSPIKSHPDTKLIEETILTVRTHLPSSEIILTFDGVRSEQEDRRQDYEEFTRRMLWKCNFEYKNVLPIIFDKHMHQTGMMRAIVDSIRTPLVLYVEADTPLTPDEKIDWDNVVDVLMSGEGDVVRFHFEAHIPHEHEHMMHGTILNSKQWYMRTSQWSQRPHVATVAFYKRIINTHFSPKAKSFIEDKMHGVVSNAYLEDGINGWYSYRVLIYYPEGGNIKRSYHIDGREGERKFDGSQVF